MKKFKKTKKIGRKHHKAQGTDLVTEFYKVNQGKEMNRRLKLLLYILIM